VQCDALDLVSQGRTEAEACATLREEAALYLGHARDAGTLIPLLERLDTQAKGKGDSSFELNLSQLP
jgi:predicted RNase H-like HicB family nuclease